MNEDYSHLIVPFAEFEHSLQAAILAGEELMKTPNKQDQLKDFLAAKDKWNSETQDSYQSFFAEKNNWFTLQFKLTAQHTKKTFNAYWEEFKYYNDEIRMKCYQLREALKTIAVCDLIRDKDNTEIKRNLTLNEKASLLLEKLYLLDNDSNHLARMLLVGSGVELKKPNEAIEIATYLKDNGLADTLHYAGPNDIVLSISTRGKVVYEEHMQQAQAKNSPHVQESISDMTGIFIVHGHNSEMKETVARVVNRIGFEEIILHEQATKGMTVIEKFKAYSDKAQYAIVLLSADDFAYSKNTDAQNAKLRPRQNVVFELGYFVGKLGRERVFCLYETLDNFELHSDFAGVVLEEFDAKGAWKRALGNELEALGIDVNWKALMK